jgi:hypothetical protein
MSGNLNVNGDIDFSGTLKQNGVAFSSGGAPSIMTVGLASVTYSSSFLFTVFSGIIEDTLDLHP